MHPLCASSSESLTTNDSISASQWQDPGLSTLVVANCKVSIKSLQGKPMCQKSTLSWRWLVTHGWHTKNLKCPTNPTKRCKKLTLAACSIIYLHPSCPSYKIKELHKLHTNAPCASPQAPVFLSEFRLRAQDGAKWRKAVPQPTRHKWQGLGKAKTLGIAWRATLCNSASVSGLKEASRLAICASICPCQLSEAEFNVGLMKGKMHLQTHFWTCVCAYLYASVCVLCVDMQTDMHTYRHTSHYVTSQCRLDWNWHLYNIYTYVHYITLNNTKHIYIVIVCLCIHSSLALVDINL